MFHICAGFSHHTCKRIFWIFICLFRYFAVDIESSLVMIEWESEWEILCVCLFFLPKYVCNILMCINVGVRQIGAIQSRRQQIFIGLVLWTPPKLLLWQRHCRAFNVDAEALINSVDCCYMTLILYIFSFFLYLPSCSIYFVVTDLKKMFNTVFFLKDSYSVFAYGKT